MYNLPKENGLQINPQYADDTGWVAVNNKLKNVLENKSLSMKTKIEIDLH